MPRYKSMIAKHSDSVNRLKEQVNVTVKLRDRSKEHMAEWKDACANFHGFRSKLDDFMHDKDLALIGSNPELREFVFDYLTVDPIYFRSGYIKEQLLRWVKTLKLTGAEKQVLQQTIIRRIKTKAFRDFRQFCQLIPKICTDTFAGDLISLSNSDDGSVRHRATFALKYIPQSFRHDL